MDNLLEIEQEQKCAQTPGLIQMSPWAVQGVVYELITNFFLHNSPESMGYPFKLKYDSDKLKSDIYVDIAYNYNAAVANKRPSIFISRGHCGIKGLTLNSAVGENAAESEVSRLLINSVPINVAVVASPIMLVELLADYTKQSFISFQQEIQSDFGFRRFRVTQVSNPQIYVEAKEYFVINLSIEIVYDEGWTLRRDDLKLKSIGRAIYDSLEPLYRWN